jgi:hypothetical protein
MKKAKTGKCTQLRVHWAFTSVRDGPARPEVFQRGGGARGISGNHAVDAAAGPGAVPIEGGEGEVDGEAATGHVDVDIGAASGKRSVAGVGKEIGFFSRENT